MFVQISPHELQYLGLAGGESHAVTVFVQCQIAPLKPVDILRG